MPVFLKDSNGMDTFACDCCCKVFPRISMHEHHKIKKCNGGQDTRINIAILDAHCHHALHQIEAAIKNEKKRLYVPDLLRQLFPDNPKAREYCLYLATTAAMNVDEKHKENRPAAGPDYSMFDTEEMVHLTAPSVSPRVRDLVNRVCTDLRGGSGRKLGVGTYIRMLIEADLRKRGYSLELGRNKQP